MEEQVLRKIKFSGDKALIKFAREELKIDEFEWIEVRQRILNYLAEQKTDFLQKPFSSTNNWRWTETLERDIRRLRMRS